MLPRIMTKTRPLEQPATAPCWQTDRGTVGVCRFTDNDRSGQLDLRAPQQGVRLDTRPGDAGPPTELLAVRLPAGNDQPVDSWVRGSTAVAIHEPRDSRRLRITSLWRFRPNPAALTLELVLSAQTALVRSDGAVAVDCRLPAAAISLGITADSPTEWTPVTTNLDGPRPIEIPWQHLPDAAVLCLLFHRAVRDQSVAVLVRRDEGRQLRLRQTTAADVKPAQFALTNWFFPTLIEKGVLHRSRLQAVLGPGKNDREWAAAAAAGLARQPPLLQ